MKTKLEFVTLIILIVLAGSCSENSAIRNAETVESYIGKLRSNQYDSISLPSFTHNDIPALLEYRNETQVITNFPTNPISSYYGPDCTLGMYVLWTIESIRARAVSSKPLILGFPSQNPILAVRNAGELVMVFDNASHQSAAKAYHDWWKNNEHQNFDDFKNIDPLLATIYKWH